MENELFGFIAKYMPLSDEEKQAITDLGIFKFAYEVIIRLINEKLFNHKNLTELFMDSTDIRFACKAKN